MKSNKSMLYDRKIIDRVKLYLEQNVEHANVNVARMTRELMRRYPDYNRRKFGPFCKLVLEAFHIISKSLGINQELNFVPEQLSSQEEKDEVVFPKRNLMSGMMNTLYNKPKAIEPRKSSIEQQPISILSSDDDSNDGPTTNGKPMENTGPGVEVGGGSEQRPLVSTDVALLATKRTAPSSFGVGNQPPKRRRHSRRKTQEPRSIFNLHQSEEDSVSNISNGSHVRGRLYKKEVCVKKPDHKFEEIGGMESTLKELCELLINIKSPDIYFQLGLLPPRGILLHGPTGCGKTLLAEAIAGQLNLPFIEVAATELIAGVSGESEERIRDIFDQAAEHSPCILFIDEIHTISSNRTFAQKDMERRVVSQLISCLDDLKNSDGGQSVLVIGATTRPDVIDPALRRFGRFDHEIQISIPSRKGRRDILMILSRVMGVEPGLDFDKLADLTPGYVGADLHALITRAASIAVKRKCTQNFRNLEAKRLMETVDLDDDDTESSPSKSSPIKGGGEEKKVNSKKIGDDNEESDNGEKSEEVNKDKEEVNENDVSKETDEESPKEEDAMEVVDEKADDEKVNDEKVDDEKVDDEKVDNEKIGDENVEEEKDKKILNRVESEQERDAFLPINEDYEPTLLQLTNWLENPPDDFNEPDFYITMPDILAALKVVQPSAKREGFITVPNVTWDDIGSLHNIREELKLAVLAPVKYPEKLAKLGLTSPSGVLLCGPPGCGKTLLAKAIANEAGINFISVKGPELMNMYVGESERAVRACFQRARNSAPCVIFFDEFDSLCPKRSEGNESGSGTRIVNQLLTEMDGVEERKGVYVLAATNRPDIIDPAILRPGRLDTILYVGLPEQEDRVEILKASTKNGTRPLLADDVDFYDLADKTDGYTGADLAGLVKQASMLALRESLKYPDQNLDDLCVCKEDFEQAINLLRPSVGELDRKVYEKLRLKYAAPRDQIKNPTI